MFKIVTPYGQYQTSTDYLVNERGHMGRQLHMPLSKFVFYKDWKFLGIEHVKRSEFIPFDLLKNWTPEQFEKFEWCYKNGNPQWTIRDRDHGTTRTWGNTKHHGIKYMRKERP